MAVKFLYSIISQFLFQNNLLCEPVLSCDNTGTLSVILQSRSRSGSVWHSLFPVFPLKFIIKMIIPSSGKDHDKKTMRV